MRTVGWVLALLLLGVTGVLGLWNGYHELAGAHTPLQKSVTYGVLLYGLFGAAATAALIVRHRWSVRLTLLWGLAVVYVATAAVPAYATADATVGGAVASGLATALIVAFVVWIARIMTRPRPAPLPPVAID